MRWSNMMYTFRCTFDWWRRFLTSYLRNYVVKLWYYTKGNTRGGPHKGPIGAFSHVAAFTFVPRAMVLEYHTMSKIHSLSHELQLAASHVLISVIVEDLVVPVFESFLIIDFASLPVWQPCKSNVRFGLDKTRSHHEWSTSIPCDVHGLIHRSHRRLCCSMSKHRAAFPYHTYSFKVL